MRSPSRAFFFFFLFGLQVINNRMGQKEYQKEEGNKKPPACFFISFQEAGSVERSGPHVSSVPLQLLLLLLLLQILLLMLLLLLRQLQLLQTRRPQRHGRDR